MKNFNLNFKSIVQSKARWLLTLIAILTLGVGQMWGDDAAMYVVGNPVQSWDNNTTYRISTGYGQDHKYYIVVYMEHNEYFALSHGTKRYAPATQHTALGIGTNAVQGDYNHTDNSWQYTGPTGLVKICISQKDLADTYYPYVWVEKYWDPKDDINAVLAGTKVMFYFGDQWSKGYKKLYSNSNKTGEVAFWLAQREGSFYVSGTNWGSFRWGAASMASARHYVSDDNKCVQMGESAVAGKAYMLYWTGSADAVATGDNRSQASFNAYAPYTIEYGTSASSVGASLAANSSTSVIGKTNSIYKYYTKPSAGSTWSEFDPSQNISLAPGTYNLAVIVTDGLIYVKAATTTLTVTETTYTVSVSRNNSSYGTVSTPSVTAGAYTSPSITATAAAGYYFTGWTLQTGVTAASGYTTSSNPICIHASASDKTITANFAARWVLRGSDMSDGTDELPGWSTTTANMTAGATTTNDVTLKPNTRYKYRIYDLKNPSLNSGYGCGATGSTDQALGTAWTLNGSNDAHFTTKGYGTYRFSVTVDGSTDRPSVTVTGPTSYAITMGQKTFTDGCWTPVVDSEGGEVAAEDDAGYPITNGKFVASGGSVTFTASPADGFVFSGWYGNNTCTGDALSTENPYTVSSITSAKTVYAKFEEVTFEVDVYDGNGFISPKIKVGKKSHPSITAATISGKVFNRWEIATGSATFGDAYSKTTTVSGVTDAQTTIVATHKDPPTLYYVIDRVTSGWAPSKMYVYFYNNDYWNKDYGSGSYWNSSTNLGCIKVAEMTPVEGKNNKWWKYTFNPETDEDLAGHSIASVSFMEKKQDNISNFNNNNTGTHRDYHSCMNMFVVTTTGGTNHLNGNTCWYYNDGYWYNYESTKSGYYLHNLPGDEVEFIANSDGIYTASVNLEENHDYYFYIGGCDGKNWANDDNYTGANHQYQIGIFNDISGDGNKIHFKTNEGGVYKFQLSPVFDTPDDHAKMLLDIVYPIQNGDYRARYNNAASSPTVSRPSNTISSSKNNGYISLWLNKGTNYISFEKATVNGSTGALTWSSVGSQQTVTGVAENGVYTMKLTKSGDTYSVNTPEPYVGDFYIRTDCAFGGWKDYIINSMTANTLTFDKNDATTFDYYYCKWIKQSGSNVRFSVANEWNNAISDTLLGDDILGGIETETLPEPANVRFAWNSHTNALSRAYLSGATDPNDRFLILHGNKVSGDNKVLNSSGGTINHHSTYDNLNENEEYFSDKNNWVYQVELKAKSGATVYLTAKYNGEDRPLYASSSSPKGILTSSSTTNSYPITATYDFKTNNMLIAWHPGDDPQIADNLSGLPSVMVIRDHQSDAEQITFNGGSISGTRVYGVMKFNKYTLNNQDRSSHATLDPGLTEYARSLFWISFPFDVRLKDAFGFGNYGQHWIIEYYDGAGRAKNGWWLDSDTNWKFVMNDSLEHGGPDKQGYILKANVGYVLALDLEELRTYSSVWNNSVEDVYLYFPSMASNVVINNELPTSIVVPTHECTIERDDRNVKDCNWNVIGVPIFANDETGLTIGGGVKFYYAWNSSTNEVSAEPATATGVMKAMHSYMVQFAGTINWSTHKMTPATVAPRRVEGAPKDNYLFCLDLKQGDVTADKAYIELSNDATSAFDINMDLTKMLKNSTANIYTLIAGKESNIQVSGNCLPLNTEQTTIVPVGVKVVTNGDYTFSMPNGTNGIGVTLIDNETGIRTSLSALDYTINLNAGTYDNRFLLEISPIAYVPTDIEEVTSGETRTINARKVMIDGVLYIVKDGKMYDARGTVVK